MTALPPNMACGLHSDEPQAFLFLTSVFSGDAHWPNQTSDLAAPGWVTSLVQSVTAKTKQSHRNKHDRRGPLLGLGTLLSVGEVQAGQMSQRMFPELNKQKHPNLRGTRRAAGSRQASKHSSEIVFSSQVGRMPSFPKGKTECPSSDEGLDTACRPCCPCIFLHTLSPGPLEWSPSSLSSSTKTKGYANQLCT